MPDECRHEGPLLIEPEDDEESYRAVCLTCLASGPPRTTHGEALEGLLARHRR